MPRSLRIFQDDTDFPLDQISVASPCPAEWGDMVGSDTVRFCASCQKNVYNLSGMKRDEAIDLLRATEGRVCVRFFRRADGTVLTEDCPVGVALVLRRAKRATLAAAAISLGAVAAMLAFLGGSLTRRTCERIDDVRTTIDEAVHDIDITSPIEPQRPVMGAPPPMLPPPVPTTGEAIAPPPRPHEVKGDVSIPRPVMGKMKAPTPPSKHMGVVARPHTN